MGTVVPVRRKFHHLVFTPVFSQVGKCLVFFTKLTVFSRFIFTRVGVWCVLEKDTPKKPAPNPALEKAYSKSKKWSEREVCIES